MVAKYIIFEDEYGMETPIIFPNWVTHASMMARFPGVKRVSAGFISGDSESLTAYGYSVSLKLSSREEDTSLIIEALR